MKDMIKVADIYARSAEFADKTVTVGGWARSIRDMKNFAFLSLNDGSCFKPLQVVLREILIMNSIELENIVDDETMMAKVGLAELLKYSLIIVSSAPVLIMYPFVKKFFAKGVMLGSLKG